MKGGGGVDVNKSSVGLSSEAVIRKSDTLLPRVPSTALAASLYCAVFPPVVFVFFLDVPHPPAVDVYSFSQ